MVVNLIAHRSPISGIATHGNRLVATAGYDNQIIIWDAQLKAPVSRAHHDHLVNQLAFSADGRFLVSASSDHTARLWSVPSLKLLAVFAQQLDDVEMAAFHPFLELVATASRDGCIRVYDFNGNLKNCFSGHRADVISVVWSPAGNALISSSDDGTIKHWSLEHERPQLDIDLGGIETDTIAVTQSGIIYAGNDVGNIIVLRGGETELFDAHACGIKRLIHHDKLNLLVSLSYDRMMRVWDVANISPAPIAASQLPSMVWPRSCAFLNDHTLVFATFGSSFAEYRIDTDTWNIDDIHATPGINAVAIHHSRELTIGDAGVLHIDGRAATQIGSLCNFLIPAGDRVLTGGQLGCLVDALTGDLLYQHRSPLNCGAVFERDGVAHVIIGTYTGEGLVFAVPAQGAISLVATLPLHANAVKAIAVAGGLIFAVCADTGAVLFSCDRFAEAGRVHHAHQRIANGCAALPDGRFVSVSRDLKLRIWDRLQATVIDTPHDHSIKCVAVSADGRHIASGSYSGTIAIYDQAGSRWRSCARPTTAGISSLCFDAGGNRFLAASYDGRCHAIGLEP